MSAHLSYLAYAGGFALSGALAAAAEPVALWSFGGDGVAGAATHGDVQAGKPGPRPPEFPDFEAENTALALGGKGARLVVDGIGAGGSFAFTNGDAITLEAWVNLLQIGEGENRYIIGKGRTGDSRFAKDNQNWALRLRGADGLARVSFLFATPPEAGGDPWHRWTSDEGFDPAIGWHHVAVSYEFGRPESVAGWIDGKKVAGSWDMGGPTEKAPVVDGDAVWIGSALGGSAANSFHGLLDDVAGHRRVVPEDEMVSRFRRVGRPREALANSAPELGDLPAGEVLFTASEGLSSHTRWAGQFGVELVTRSSFPNFYLHRLPFRYDDWGIRASWRPPVRTRIAADVPLPVGTHRVLVRTRGLSRLWADGEKVLETNPHAGATGGHGLVLDLPEPPVPGLSRVAYGEHETFGEIVVAEGGGAVRVVLESIVGGKAFRAEPGEMCVAIQLQGDHTFRLLAPSGEAAAEITDVGLRAARAECERRLAAHDKETRDAAAASRDGYWAKRHAHAGAVAAGKGFAQRSIDAFLATKITDAKAAAEGGDVAGARQFHDEVLPVLSKRCFRCHGEKEKGDLRLDSRDAALAVIDLEDPGASELIARVTSDDPDERMPPEGKHLIDEELALLRGWIAGGAKWPAPPLPEVVVSGAPAIGDAGFLRRAYLDTVGVPPAGAEVRAFLADASPNKRAELIDRLLADGRFADHWVSYWQDVLAENPSMLKPSLNNTGPFRWFLHEALRDDKPLDRMVSELLMLRGSEREGGSAGFGFAADNDSPFAAKAHIVGTAFLGVEMQCARCHDAPFHKSKQRDLYSLAGMLGEKPLAAPRSSTVPASFFEGREGRPPLIKVTLKPGEKVEPSWPFAGETGVSEGDVAALVGDATRPRSRLAALVTAPENTRFAKVMVNRLWRRLAGAGFVEPVHDWEGAVPSHPELLDWLANELLASGYDQKHVLRLIMNSEFYGRASVGRNREAAASQRFFAAPDRRRMSAEQVVDSLYAASGRQMDVEELSFDPDGRRPGYTMISLGHPKRAWQFGSLSNERDRPSLALPRAQAVSDVLRAFGWSATRPGPVNDRETAPDVLQPGVLANSTLSTWITRASDRSALAELAVAAASPEELVDSLFLSFLGREPTSGERSTATNLLADGFGERLVPADQIVPIEPLEPLRRVSWTNHLNKEANRVKLVAEQRARDGDPADPRLRSGWRERYEDLVWSLINSPEFVWIP